MDEPVTTTPDAPTDHGAGTESRVSNGDGAGQGIPVGNKASGAGGGRGAPKAFPKAGAVELPETLRYRLKDALLGPPIASERQSLERLGKPTALAVLSSDVISSSAYATEQVLLILVPIIGVAAFTLVIPVSIAVILVLAVVAMSYLEVVKVYTKAGGAYVVARENFGLGVAQIAAVALLIDYTLTVAVSVAAGVAALTSAFPSLIHATVWMSIAFVILIAYGNLRGIREAGRVFAAPTYFFIANMAILIVVGGVRAVLGQLHPHSLHRAGAIPIGHAGSGLLLGASLFIVLKAFASGGTALTGTEAISNGVSVFRQPEARNARITLVVMSVILGSLVMGVGCACRRRAPGAIHVGDTHRGVADRRVRLRAVDIRAGPLLLPPGRDHADPGSGGQHQLHRVPVPGQLRSRGLLSAPPAQSPWPPARVLHRGDGPHRRVGRAAARDGGQGRQPHPPLRHRGVHRVHHGGFRDGQVPHHPPRAPLAAGGGHQRHGRGAVGHRRRHFRRHQVQTWRLGCGHACCRRACSPLLRLHRQYQKETEQLEVGVTEAAEAPVLRTHEVVVFVDRLDLATARAIQYARTLSPDNLRVVHFAIDPRDAAELESEWGRLGLSRVPLDIVECPDRRLARAALELAAEITGGGTTELTILLPRRGFAGGWRRLLHDGSADRIAAAVSQLPHVNATIVPFQLAHQWPHTRRHGSAEATATRTARAAQGRHHEGLGPKAAGTVPIGEVQWRQRVRVAGRIRSVRVPTRTGTANLECVLADDSGQILLVFQGRRRIPGIQQGGRLVASGMAGAWDGQLAILNPDYELIAGPDTALAGLDA